MIALPTALIITASLTIAGPMIVIWSAYFAGHFAGWWL